MGICFVLRCSPCYCVQFEVHLCRDTELEIWVKRRQKKPIIVQALTRLGSSSYSLVAGTPANKQQPLTMAAAASSLAELCKVCHKMPPCNRLCNTCKQSYSCIDMVQIQSADPLAGTKHQERCRLCTKLFAAMTRAKAKFGDTDGWEGLAQEERTQFMARSHGLLGAELKKAMTESVQESRMTRTTTVFSQSGKFIDIEGQEGAKEKYKDEPEKLAKLLANSKEITCPIFGSQKIWIPEYSASKTVEDREEEVRKRHASTEQVMRPKKAPKKRAIASGIQGASASGEAANAAESGAKSADVPKPIPQGQLKRLEKCIPALEDLRLRFSQKLSEVEAPDNEGVIGEKVVEKARGLETTLAQVLAETTDIFAKKTSNCIKDLFGKVATITIEVKKMTKKLTAHLETDDE